jgi:hypothetical protein
MPTQVTGLSVTAAFFETLGVRPTPGRTFTADEDRPIRAPTVVLSGRSWRRYSSRSESSARRWCSMAASHTIVGVVPEGFAFWRRDRGSVRRSTNGKRAKSSVWRGPAGLRPGLVGRRPLHVIDDEHVDRPFG